KPQFSTKAIKRTFELPPIPNHLIALAAWLPKYYPSGLGPVGQLLLPGSLPEKSLQFINHQDRIFTDAKLPSLTSEQSAVIKEIVKPGTYLLHGETGTGKTRIYIELTRRTLAQNKSVIILTPEISLTPQLARDFQNIFGDQVFVKHSRLPLAERRN